MTVTGINSTQQHRAQAVLNRTAARGFPAAAGRIAIAVCLTESSLLMYANRNNPTSMAIPHDAVGQDHGSVGLYQQQVGGAVNSTANWGTTQECMDVTHSTDSFLNALNRLHGWQNMPTWQAAQEVQGSFDPTGGNYKRNMTLASSIVDALWPHPAPQPASATHTQVGSYTVQSGDSLTTIAYRYPEAWITAGSIATLNNLSDPNAIFPGQVLRIG